MTSPDPDLAPYLAPDWDTLTEAFQDLHDQLQRAYWKATPGDAKDQITELTHDVSSVLTSLYQGELADNTQQYKRLSAQIKSVNKDLGDFQKQINNLVNDVNIATQVVSAIAQAADQYAKVMA
jgi:ABC-type transporter Mla subunit MlaD